MENFVLSVDNGNAVEKGYESFYMVQKEFLILNLSLETVATMQEALLALSKQDYVLVIIMEGTVDFLPQLHIMRDLKPMPIIVMSTVCDTFAFSCPVLWGHYKVTLDCMSDRLFCRRASATAWSFSRFDLS